MPGSVLRQRSVAVLVVSTTVSEVGSRVTALVLPVIAATVLAATPWQMGVLQACGMAAFLVVGLPAGALVDRWRPRRVMVVCDLVRAALLVSVPVVAWLGGLSLTQLFAVALATGVATVFADVSAQSLVPSLVTGERLVEANSALQVGFSSAAVVGPGLGGLLLRVAAAPVALLADVGSFLLSAAMLPAVPAPARPARDDRAGRSLRREIGEGVRFVLGHPVLRRVVASTAVMNAASGLRSAVLVLFALRRLGLTPSSLGVVLAVGAFGGIAGAVTVSPLTRLVGQARLIPASALCLGPFAALAPLAVVGAAPVLLAVSTAGLGWATVAYNVSQLSLRQRQCPPELLGRMNASIRTIIWGITPIGALAGGVLATWLGLVSVLWTAAAAMMLAAAPVLLSPLRRNEAPVVQGAAL